MASSQKEVGQLIKQIEAAGGIVTKSKRNGHYKVYFEGRLITVLASTASDHRSIKNARSQCRRGGLDV